MCSWAGSPDITSFFVFLLVNLTFHFHIGFHFLQSNRNTNGVSHEVLSDLLFRNLVVDDLLLSPDLDHRPGMCAGWGAMHAGLFRLDAEDMVALPVHGVNGSPGVALS